MDATTEPRDREPAPSDKRRRALRRLMLLRVILALSLTVAGLRLDSTNSVST